MAKQVVDAHRANQFTAFFTRMPQTGTLANNKFLHAEPLDMVNKSIKEFTFPGINFSVQKVPTGGFFDVILPGDTFESGPFSMSFLLDKDLTNWRALTNWGLIMKDIIGGGGVKPGFTQTGRETTGEIAFQFIDVALKPVFQVNIEVFLTNLPDLTYSTGSNEDVIFAPTFEVVDIRNIAEVIQDENR